MKPQNVSSFWWCFGVFNEVSGQFPVWFVGTKPGVFNERAQYFHPPFWWDVGTVKTSSFPEPNRGFVWNPNTALSNVHRQHLCLQQLYPTNWNKHIQECVFCDQFCYDLKNSVMKFNINGLKHRPTHTGAVRFVSFVRWIEPLCSLTAQKKKGQQR